VVEGLIDVLYGTGQVGNEFLGGSGEFAEEEGDDQGPLDTDTEVLHLDHPPPGRDGRIIRMVNQILDQALRAAASDIHLEPFEDGCKIRLRIDGLLHDVPSPSRNLFLPIVSRFKLTFASALRAFLRRVTSKPHRRVTLDDKVAFFRQLSTLVSAGTPLLQAIRIGAEQSQSIRLRYTLEEIAGRVAAGSPFHAAAASHLQVFEPHWIEVIRTGEITGQMSGVLLELNKQIQEARETRRKISGALAYPITLVVVAAAVSVMLWLVVPTFAQMFHEMAAELPAMTQYVVGASDFIVRCGLYLLGGLLLGVFAFRQYLRSEGAAARWSASPWSCPWRAT
jgi:hypothetical protein